MSESGWIKIHRKILNSPVVTKDTEYFTLWIYLLLTVTHKEYKTDFGGEVIILKPGQWIYGRKKISEELGVSESKVQRILKRFENEHLIKQQTTPKGRIISIVNWDKYQTSEQQNEQQVNNYRTTSEQLVNTKQEYKNTRIQEIDNKSWHPDGTLTSEQIRQLIKYNSRSEKPTTPKKFLEALRDKPNKQI